MEIELGQQAGQVVVGEVGDMTLRDKVEQLLVLPWIRRSRLSLRMRRHFGGRSPAVCLNKWRRTFHDLHSYRQMRVALDRRFTARFFAWTPYMHEYPGGISSEPVERRLIAAGAIQPLGFRYVGQRRLSRLPTSSVVVE